MAKSHDKIDPKKSVTKLHYYLETVMWFAIIISCGTIFILVPPLFMIFLIIIHYKGNGNRGNSESESGMF